MLVIMALFTMLLFYLLTPGVLLNIPKSGSLKQRALVHAVVFALIYSFTHKLVWKFFYN
jgi:hypothetical protein